MYNCYLNVRYNDIWNKKEIILKLKQKHICLRNMVALHMI